MLRSNLIYYSPKLGWILKDSKELRKFAQRHQQQVAIVSYGCDLDYDTIYAFIENNLMPFNRERQDAEVEMWYEMYDANAKNPMTGMIHFWISEQLLQTFEQMLSQVSGKHVRCEHNIRGHFEVMINGKEYSTRVYKVKDCSAVYREAMSGRYLYVVDEESEDNPEIRSKMHTLPRQLQSLTLPVHVSDIQREVYIKDWIHRILTNTY